MAGSKFSRLGMSSPMSTPHSSSSADDGVTEDDDVTEDEGVTEEDDVTEEKPTEDDADKVDDDAAKTVADVVAILADDADVAASDVIAAVVPVTLLAVSPKAVVAPVTASFFDSESPSNFIASFSSSICPSFIWASFRWKKEPPDGEERGAAATRR
jgi:hypothetical protein